VLTALVCEWLYCSCVAVQLPKSVKIGEHVADLRAFIDTALEGRRPVVVAHSFGGVLSMQVQALPCYLTNSLYHMTSAHEQFKNTMQRTYISSSADNAHSSGSDGSGRCTVAHAECALCTVALRVH
jgi:hypothetical protein